MENKKVWTVLFIINFLFKKVNQTAEKNQQLFFLTKKNHLIFCSTSVIFWRGNLEKLLYY